MPRADLLQLEQYLGLSKVLRLIEETLGVGIWRCDTAGQIQWSRGFYGLLGLDPQTVAPSFEEIQTRIHPEDRWSPRRPGETLLDQLMPDGEFRIIQPDGALRWLRGQTQILLNSCGEPECVIGVALDITNQLRMIRQLKVETGRYSALTHVADGLLWIGNSDGRITTLLNAENAPEGQRLLGRGWLDLLHEEERASTLEACVAAVETAQPYKGEHRLRQPDGSYRWYRCRAVPVTNPDGSIREWLGISIDVHHQRLSNQPPEASRLTGAQLRAARGILNWSVKQLAALTGITSAVIRRLEEFNGAAQMSDETNETLRRVFTNAGIEFLFSSTGKPGVRPR